MHGNSILQMVFGAGPMVRFVLLLLLSASVVSWAVIFRKFIVLYRTKRESEMFLKVFWRSATLAEAHANTRRLKDSSLANVFRAGYDELVKFGKSGNENKGEVVLEKKATGKFSCMANIERALRKAINAEANNLSQTLPFLATTGSIAPFVGLFGTVWGIMAAFQDIGLRGSANLATVAPGISEALIATAAGLAAAIPAVGAYNYYVNAIRRVESDMYSFSSDFANLIEREYASGSVWSGNLQASEG